MFSPDRAGHLTGIIAAGNSTQTALKVAGIAKSTFHEWMQRGARGEEPYAGFRTDIERARAQAEARHVTQVAAAAVDDWHAATYMLDRQLRRRDDLEEELVADVSGVLAEVLAAATQEAHRALEASGEDAELSEGAIDRYAASVVCWRALEYEWIRLGRPATTLGGATGLAQVPHPLIGAMASARREATELAAVLGLDPRSRQRIRRPIGAGRPLGAASSPDRAQPPMRLVKGGAE